MKLCIERIGKFIMKKYIVASKEFNPNNAWKLLSQVLGVDIQRKFNAYGWYKDSDIKVSKDCHWSGWWNEYYDFITVFPKTGHGRDIIDEIESVFRDNGYDITYSYGGGINIGYSTMTKEESDNKEKRNLLNGGRMSD